MGTLDIKRIFQLKELVKMWKARNGVKATVEEMIAVLETMPQATNILDQLRKAVDKNGEEVESKKRKSQVSEGRRFTYNISMFIYSKHQYLITSKIIEQWGRTKLVFFKNILL